MVEDSRKEKGDHATFISMPEEAIKSLRTELSNLLGERLADGVLFRFGFRCGEALVERRISDNLENTDIHKTLPEIWSQTCLGDIVNIEEISEEEIEIEQEESTEAHVTGPSDTPSCNYTRGYLAGIASILTKKKFYCIETECISEGKDTCRFQLVVFPHKVYVAKKTS